MKIKRERYDDVTTIYYLPSGRCLHVHKGDGNGRDMAGWSWVLYSESSVEACEVATGGFAKENRCATHRIAKNDGIDADSAVPC